MEDGDPSLTLGLEIEFLIYETGDLLKTRGRPQPFEFRTFGSVISRVMAWSSQRHSSDESTSHRAVQPRPLFSLGPASIAREAPAGRTRIHSSLGDWKRQKSECSCEQGGNRSHCCGNLDSCGPDNEQAKVPSLYLLLRQRSRPIHFLGRSLCFQKGGRSIAKVASLLAKAIDGNGKEFRSLR